VANRPVLVAKALFGDLGEALQESGVGLARSCQALELRLQYENELAPVLRLAVVLLERLIGLGVAGADGGQKFKEAGGLCAVVGFAAGNLRRLVQRLDL